MILRFLTREDAPLVEELWSSCFEKRSEPFFQYYFQRYCWQQNRIFGGFSQRGELITMMHLNPYVLQIKGRRVQAPYIVGVATAEKFRGHHHMGEMLKECCELLRQAGTELVFLMPIAEEIYTPYGFVGVDYHTYSHVENLQKHYQLLPCGLDRRILAPLYEEYMQDKNGVIRRDAEWEKLLTLVELEQHRICLLQREGHICGYAFVDSKGVVGELIAPEPQPRGNKAFIMAKTLQGQDVQEYFGDNTYINEYF